MIQIILVVFIMLGASVWWFEGGQSPFGGSVATTTNPVAVVESVETLLEDIATRTAVRREDVLGESLGFVDGDLPAALNEFPVRYPMQIGTTAVEASVATSLPDRVRGLSGTKNLPDSVVKLFIFETDEPHGIWMKDMNYPIDILWVDGTGTIVHIAPNTLPDTYPESFSSPVPARYVIEAVAGFVAKHNVAVGTRVELPTL
ncbi:DUF192 domain-containing protein [Patescibacteria group bacterium]|nr:DUF192 domain-containing protein [Patescibacteria group bacterium]